MTQLRVFLLCSILVGGLAASAQAQVIAGSSFTFDHALDEYAYVTGYQLCVGVTTATPDCREIGVVRQGTTDALVFTLPSWVPRGRRDLTVRAVWKAPLSGVSGPSNVLQQVVVGGPERLRVTTPTAPP